MKLCKLTIADEVNVCLTGVTDNVHTALTKLMRRFLPAAVHMPKYKLKRWDGYIQFYKNGWTYLNLIDESFIKMLESFGYEIEFVDRRVPADFTIPPIDENFFEGFLTKEGQPLLLRDFQVFAVNKTFEERCGILEMATGSGKSLTCAAIAKQYQQHGKVILIVPSIDLVKQTAETFRNVGFDSVGEFYGKEKIVEATTISTWQSLIHYPEILDGVVCLIADECHEYSAKEVHELLTVAAKNVPCRFGFTGTVPKADINLRQLTSSLGPVIYTKKAWELQEAGILATCDIDVLIYHEDEIELDNTFKDYHEEAKYLANSKPRRKEIAKKILEVSETGNTLVLVKNIENGERLCELIPGSVFMYGANSSKQRTHEYKSIQEGENKVLICTYGIASTGIDIPRLFNVVIIDAGRDIITIIQSIGRGLRKFADKSHVKIHDITSNLKFSKKHYLQRCKLYKEHRYPYMIIPINYK